MGYATGADLVDRYDIDLVGDLATDDRETLDRNSVRNHSHVLTALEDASGEVDVALQAGGRYTADQLCSLTGSSLSHLKSIVCALAMARLHERRPEAVDSDFIERLTKRANESIRELRRGENVFGLDEHVDAGRTELTGPTALDLQNRNDVTTRMSRYFPLPNTRLRKN